MAHFLVAGGGIAGLVAALALARAGHEVDVHERRTVFEEAGAGLQLSPNATRVAAQLGCLGRLEAVAVEPACLQIRRGRDGRVLATIPFERARARYGAPFLLLLRADLLRVLADAADAHPAIRLLFGSSLTQFDPAHATAVLDGATGPVQVEADGIIRAEGLHASRAVLSGAPRYSGKIAWRALVPAADLPRVFARLQSNLWLGSRAHLVHYPVRGGSVINVVAILAQGKPSATAPDVWGETGDPAILRAAFQTWDALARALIDAAPDWKAWPLFDGEPRSWTDGRQTAVGDAAHPMLPFLAQGASQAFEDAAALSEAVTAHPGDVRTAFRAYEIRRGPAAARVQAASRKQGHIYHLAGPAARVRDLAMALLGPDQLLARLDWLYGASAPEGSA